MLRRISREIARTYRKRFGLFAITCVLIGSGIGVSSTSLLLLHLLSGVPVSGMLPGQYTTIASQSGAGAAMPLSWQTIEEFGEPSSWTDPRIAAYAQPFNATLLHESGRWQVDVAGASPAFFAHFIEPMSAGSVFAEPGGTSSRDGGVIISSGLSRHLFGSPSASLGQTISLNGHAFRINAVTSPSFKGLWKDTQVWLLPHDFVVLDLGLDRSASSAVSESEIVDFSKHWKEVPLFVIVTRSENLRTSDVRRRLLDFMRQHPKIGNQLEASLGLTQDPHEDLTTRSWAQLLFLLASILTVATCLNYCGIVLAEVPNRVQEVRLKIVLGAQPGQVFAEEMLRSSCAIMIGILLGAALFIGCSSLILRGKDALPALVVFPWEQVLHTLLAEVAAVAFVGILMAILPAYRVLRDAGPPQIGSTFTKSRLVGHLLRIVVVLQIASCVGACILAFQTSTQALHLSQRKLGYNASGLSSIEIGSARPDGRMVIRAGDEDSFPYERLAYQIITNGRRNLPGTRDVAASSCVPLGSPMKSILIQPMSGTNRSVSYCVVSSDYFRTLTNSIVMGRPFPNDPMIGTVDAVIVNRALAQELWPNQNPLHKMVLMRHSVWPVQFTAEVIGISDDMRYAGKMRSVAASVFIPLKGNAFTLAIPIHFLFKSTEPLESIRAYVDREASLVMPDATAISVMNVNASLQNSSEVQLMRVATTVLSAIMTAAVAALGLFGMLLQFVNGQRKEMAVRMCFGLSNEAARRTVIFQAAKDAIIGSIVAIIIARVLSMTILLGWFGAPVWSWAGALTVGVLCVVGAVVLSTVPARQFGQLNPASLLRNE